MKTIINIVVGKPGGGVECLKKEFDLPVLLVPGVEIYDSAWEGSRKIVDVTVEPDKPCATASVEMAKKSADEFDGYIKMLKSHEWSTY